MYEKAEELLQLMPKSYRDEEVRNFIHMHIHTPTYILTLLMMVV